ncbi:MAG TPA: zinc ribbon domain-containing protein [Candidatus Limnocylindrales bacterium]|nr:zinc ribbon domain-containing protein [Candidatus Limnocylindrales bacterium]
MPEILTESFCERCGTRYTFESAAPRKTRRLGQFKTLSKGVKNWVMSDDSSLDEALAAARGDEEREVTAQQLDAFHATFNFCMSCRQYTCANCWNAAEGRCLSCAPHLGQDVLQAPFPDAAAFDLSRLDAAAWPEVDLAAGANGADLGIDGLPAAASNGADHSDHNGVAHEHGGLPAEWGDAADADGNGAVGDDLPDVDALARLAFLAGDTVEPEPPVSDVAAGDARDARGAEAVAAAASAALEPTAEVLDPAVTIADAAAAEPPLPDDVDGRAAVGAARTADLLHRFRPGQNLDAELAAYEAELEARERAAAAGVDGESADAGEADAAAELAAASSAAAEELPGERDADFGAAEPVDDQPAAETAAASEPTVSSEAPEPDAGQAAAEPPRPRDDVVEQPTWRIFAPDAAPAAPETPIAPVPAPNGVPIQASAEPHWPARPDIAESPAMALLATRARTSDALWAASAQEVMGTPPGRPAVAPTGVQPCSNCGLSLSANARFCRRCGTRQG